MSVILGNAGITFSDATTQTTKAVPLDVGSAAVGCFGYGTVGGGATIADGATTSGFQIQAPANFGGTSGYKAVAGTWRNVSGATRGEDVTSEANWNGIFQRIS